ncbi:choice-of-anchor I family protein [Oceanobacillus damuensis]|uniref:choice-of-anchor I family protein n=1 Tax=Oceanobacillus damuensis TaxID=937928 RepID=UPI00082EA28E|nr:choice-of-anchor I family protein [Oceanobacillus damuensis]
MTFKKKIITGATATVLFTGTIPFNVFAEQPPLFQFSGEDLTASQVGQYDSGLGEGGTEIMAYDPELQRAFVTNGAAAGFDILSFKKLKSGKFSEVTSEKRILLENFGIEGIDDITSIASHPYKDLIAISVVSNPKTDPGYIVFATKDGEYVNHVQVGSLPDMVTFTPDGTKAVVANEGEPDEDYSVDPEGSISIIDVTGDPAEFTANNLTFEGVELDDKVRIGSEGTTLQQLEPEYAAVTDDSTTAYISLQENNAIATVDLVNEEILDVKGLGVKDHSVPGNELDAKDNNETKIEKQPLLGFYMPDAIDTFTADGKTYILTPNEGDARDYDAYSEEASIKDIKGQIQLNADHYEGYTQKELDEAVAGGLLDELGKTDITLEDGKNDEGIYESLHTYGGRSFSIFDADTVELVYDSGSDFEKITAEALPEHFNTNNDELKYDGRSDAKGPEPETVVSGEIDGTTYAFIALERFSGIMVYDLSNPLSPEFKKLISSRDFSEDVKGDVSPEGLQFIGAKQSPTGNALLATTHEVSGTVAVYEFNGKIKGSSEWNQSDNKHHKNGKNKLTPIEQ